MQRGWLLSAIDGAQKAGAALWHKQSGAWVSHPNLSEAPPALGIMAKARWLMANGWELLGDTEKGGATVDRRTFRELPAAFHTLAASLNRAAA